MTEFKNRIGKVFFSMALLTVSTPGFADEDGDIGPHVLIGQTGGTLGFAFEAIEPDPTTGSLIISVDFFGNPIDPSGFSLPATISGYSSIPFDPDRDLAFEAPGEEEADELAEAGLIPVSEDAIIALEAVDLPDNFAVFLATQSLLETTGQSLVLGSPEFDTHPFYLFETSQPLAVGSSTTGTFRLVETSGSLNPSASFDITLQVVPEPAAASLVIAGAGMMLARRRRLA